MSPGLAGGQGMGVPWPPKTETWKLQTPGAQGVEPPLVESDGDLFTRSQYRESRETISETPVSPDDLRELLAGVHRRKRRAIACFYSVRDGLIINDRNGLNVAWCTLTESDQALSAGLDFGKALDNYRRWLRDEYNLTRYAWVEHEQGKPSKVTGRPRLNRHFFFAVDGWLDAKRCSDKWLDLYRSRVSGMSAIYDPSSAAAYVARYVAQRGRGADGSPTNTDHGFNRYREAQSWVFPRWNPFRRYYAAVWKQPASLDYLADLASRSEYGRLEDKSYRRWQRDRMAAIRDSLADGVLHGTMD